MLSSMDRHVDNTFKKLYVPVHMFTGTSKVDKLLKMPSDSISEGAIFKFPGWHAPRPPNVGMPVCFAQL